MKYRVTCFLFAMSLYIHAQDVDKRIDSLKQQLPGKEGTERFDILFELSRAYGQNDHCMEALVFIDEACTFAWNTGDSVRMVRAARVKGHILSILSRPKETIALLKEVVPVAERYCLTEDLGKIYNIIGINQIYQANYPEALRFILKSLELNEKVNEKFNVSTCLHNLGVIYFKLNDLEKALNYYLRSAKIKKELHDYYDLDMLYMNIGLCYVLMKKLPEATVSFEEGYKICGSGCKNAVKTQGEYGYGRLALFQNNLGEAKLHFNASYVISRSEGDKRFESENLLKLGQIELQKKDYDNSKRYLTGAESMALSSGYKHILLDIYASFSKLYLDQKLYKLASSFQQKYITYRDSVLNVDVANKLAVIQVELEAKANAVAVANKQKIIDNQRKQTLMASIISVLLIVLTFILIKIIGDKRLANQKLDARVHERTRELETNRERLQRVYTDQANLFFKAMQDIRAPISSLKGVYRAALLDKGDGLENEYLHKMHLAAVKADEVVNRLAVIGKGRESFSTTGFSIQEILHEWQNEFSEISAINPTNKAHVQLGEKKRLVYILKTIAPLFLDSTVSATDVSKEGEEELIVTLHFLGHNSIDETWPDTIQPEVKQAHATLSYVEGPSATLTITLLKYEV
jgi:tetratricopeptide (TPR) repeat protein